MNLFLVVTIQFARPLHALGRAVANSIPHLFNPSCRVSTKHLNQPTTPHPAVQDAHALSSVRLRLVELIESQGRALLVLDNCEDVLGGPAPVALLQLLASVSGRVLLLLWLVLRIACHLSLP